MGVSPDWLEFDIHGIAGIRVAGHAPSAALFRQTLGQFLTTDLKRADLTVVPQTGPLQEAAYAEQRFRYTDTAVELASGRIQVAADRDRFELRGKGDLLEASLPLLDVISAGHSAAMIHAGTFEMNGVGCALAAWGGTGKTSTLASLLLESASGSFLGDDWAFITEDGRLLGFAKPLYIKPHHRHLYPKLFEGRHKPLVPQALYPAMQRLAATIHPAIARFPRLAAFTRQWSPEHLVVNPAAAFGRIQQEAPLGAAIFMERWQSNDLAIEPRTASWMVQRMVANFYAEMPRASRDLMTALAASGLVPAAEPIALKQQVLHQALSKVPSYLLRIPDTLSAAEASPQVAQLVLKTLSEHHDTDAFDRP